MNENTGAELPPLSDETIGRIEHGVFAAVEDEPRTAPPPAPRRRARAWITGLGVAAALVVGVVISPALINLGMNTTSESAPNVGIPAVQLPADSAGGDASVESSDAAPAVGEDPSMTVGADAGRTMITTTDVSLVVEDVATATTALADLARKYGGYVESSDIGAYPELDPSSSYAGYGTGWVSIRVQADHLDEAIKMLEDTGEIVRSSVNRQDVTEVTVDLQARIDSAQTSVDRLTELMSQSGSVGDLIAAETALTERQAQLEGYQQQLKSLEDQAAMTLISVQLTERTAVTDADPAGFGDGLIAGWNGLIVSMNALVVAIGFLAPWVVLAGIVLLVVWAVRRRARRRREATE